MLSDVAISLDFEGSVTKLYTYYSKQWFHKDPVFPSLPYWRLKPKTTVVRLKGKAEDAA